jgi:ribonuclease HI
VEEFEGRPKLTIFTDGSCYPNPGGPGGYGVVIVEPDGQERCRMGQGFRKSTNNRMEMMAAIMGLAAIGERRQDVALVSDSQYVVRGVGWATKWQANNWRTGEGKPAKNVDLWSIMLGMAMRHNIDWRWVKGHNGHVENEICDKLAGDARIDSESHFIDVGFENGESA